MSSDTIFALSSGRPPAAVSIIRVTGPKALAAGELLAGSLPRPRRASLRALRDPQGQLLDDVLMLRFDGPSSATGEDTVEFQCHGGRAVVDAILAALSAIDGLREAQPGEFTRRAFENGHVDLTEAEGLADLLEAETETQRKAALAVAGGGLRRQVGIWQQRLLALSAQAEAAIDYAEDDDVGVDLSLAKDCEALANELSEWLDRPRIEPLRDGIRVVVAGPPNAGKSSLINALAGDERAIVTDIAGTTRDLIEVPISLAGLPIILTDTAGLRDSDETVERIGIDRARSSMASADIVLWLGEAGDAPSHPRLIRLHARADMSGREMAPVGALPISSHTGAGLGALLQKISAIAVSLLPAEDALSLNRRQAGHISEAEAALRAASGAIDLALMAENVRSARVAFDRLTGQAGMEDVLDALFGRFCLGK